MLRITAAGLKRQNSPPRRAFKVIDFLMTWTHSVGAEEYLKYQDENTNISTGTLIAE
ncbi:MAG: hypothetical protein OSB69_19610 [Alphaproteobacteria bacterium]|nr:hypothetical protein [Alphaproteobacteria bacterium]